MPYNSKEKQHSWYLKNRERIISKQSLIYNNNKENKKKYSRDYYNKNRDIQLEKNKLWKQNNLTRYKELAKFHCAKRRAMIKSQMPEDADVNKIKQFYILAEELTNKTGIKYCVDHIKPISKGGLHHQDNLQVITVKDNLRKGSKYPYNLEMYFNPDRIWYTHT